MFGLNPVDVRIGFRHGFKRHCGLGQRRFGADEVDECEKAVGVEYLWNMRTQQLGKLGEYAHHFAPFLSFQFSHSVVGLNHLGGFYVYGLARGRLVMHDTLYAPFQSRHYGYHQSAVAQGRGYVALHETVALSRPQYGVERFRYAALGPCQFRTYALQFG